MNNLMNVKSTMLLTDLFHENRLDVEKMNVFYWALFLLYFPFGLLLSVVRILLIFCATLTFPERYRYYVCQWLAGVRIQVREKVELDEVGSFIVSNHSSYMDPIILNRVLAKPAPLATVIWHGVNVFSRIICRPTVEVTDKNKNRKFRQQMHDVSQTHQIVVFPEGSVTDGIGGLLRFHRSVFRLPKPIYLVAIRYKRAFPFLHGKAMSRFMGFELLVDLFQPWICVELISLGKYQRPDNLTPQQQADEAQKLIAEALGLSATCWDKEDRHDLLFKKNLENIIRE